MFNMPVPSNRPHEQGFCRKPLYGRLSHLLGRQPVYNTIDLPFTIYQFLWASNRAIFQFVLDNISVKANYEHGGSPHDSWSRSF